MMCTTTGNMNGRGCRVVVVVASSGRKRKRFWDDTASVSSNGRWCWWAASLLLLILSSSPPQVAGLVGQRRQRQLLGYPPLRSTTRRPITTTTTRIPAMRLDRISATTTTTTTTSARYRRHGDSRHVTCRSMVLTTPESIIEQASTQKLLDDLIDESTRTSARRPIMMQFDPSPGWIWKRWKGTIFSETWDSCVSKMIYAVVLLVVFQYTPFFKKIVTPQLQGFNVLWGQMLQVTTFTLTFFLNQSYALWRQCYALSRRLQGRLHDINLSLAAHATRKPPPPTSTAATSGKHGSTFTPASRQLLELIGRYSRLFNLLTYASFTRSHRPILTPRGMRRLVERGLMTQAEREVLVNCELPATQRHNAVLLWIARAFVEGWEAGHFTGHAGFEDQMLDKIHVCRAQYGAIGDELSGRMPLAYAHIVQVLVDVVLWMYPLMAISSNMSPTLAVLGTGILTVSYQGLFDLAKQFLDPYDNESFGKGEDPLVVDTLIAETNAGSVRWMNALAEFPVHPQRIKDGELSEHLLPIRGYSVEELERMERERMERERELKERRLAEEQERRLEEGRVRRVRQAAEAMIPSLYVASEYNLSVLQQEYVPRLENLSSDTMGGVLPTTTNWDKRHINTNALDAVVSSRNDENVVTVVVSKSIEDQLPILHDVSFHVAEGVADIVSRLYDIAGGVPMGLVPPQTAASVAQLQEQRPLKTTTTSTTTIIPWTTSSAEAFELEFQNGDMSGELSFSGEQLASAFEPPEVAPTTEQQQRQQQQVETEDDEEYYDEDAEEYEHIFDLESQNYLGLVWFDEYDADGKEIRLSQMLADEEWEEELAAKTEKEAKAAAATVYTFEEYTKRIEEIRDATNTELAETQEILNAPPGAEAESTTRQRPSPRSMTSKELSERILAPPIYDQTKLDGISQLWGLPPGEISDAFGYVYPQGQDVLGDEPSSFDGLMQLAGGLESQQRAAAAWKESVYRRGDGGSLLDIDDSEDFQKLGTLWGDSDFLQDLNGGGGSETTSSATRSLWGDSTGPVGVGTSYSRTMSILKGDNIPSRGSPKQRSAESDDGSGLRMSQVLADEVWPEQLETLAQIEPIATPVTFEDYEKQVAEILEAEKEEMVETAAILNAPAFAESLIGFDDDESIRLKAANETAKKYDLSILEMDEEVVETAATSSGLQQQQQQNQTTGNEELLANRQKMVNWHPNTTTGQEPSWTNSVGVAMKSDSNNNQDQGDDMCNGDELPPGGASSSPDNDLDANIIR